VSRNFQQHPELYPWVTNRPPVPDAMDSGEEVEKEDDEHASIDEK
jgi:hypothetical protein